MSANGVSHRTDYHTSIAAQDAAREMYEVSPGGMYGAPLDGVRISGCVDCRREDHCRHWHRSVPHPVLFCRGCKTTTRHAKGIEANFDCGTCSAPRKWGV
jgi:hypothetical protein